VGIFCNKILGLLRSAVSNLVEEAYGREKEGSGAVLAMAD
jgi:hypothetical protein